MTSVNHWLNTSSVNPIQRQPPIKTKIDNPIIDKIRIASAALQTFSVVTMAFSCYMIVTAFQDNHSKGRLIIGLVTGYLSLNLRFMESLSMGALVLLTPRT